MEKTYVQEWINEREGSCEELFHEFYKEKHTEAKNGI